MFSAVPPSLPVYLMGGFEGEFGQDTTITDWINTIFKPISDVAVKYYELQAQQGQTPEAKALLQTATLPSLSGISPIYLIGGGVLLWYLFKGTGERKKSRRNPCRRNPYRKRRR